MTVGIDTIVIGAGVAGLMAGLSLARAGQRVILLEARDRIGGRILTEHHEAPLELGAEFIHGLPEITWALVRDAGLRAQELGGTPYRYQHAALRAANKETAGAFGTLELMSRWYAQQPAGTDVSFGRFLAVSGIAAQQAEQASRYVEGFNAADQGLISVAALVRQQQAEDAIQADRLFHLSDGYDALPRGLADDFRSAGGDIRLAHPVQAVSWCRDAVTVSGTSPPFSLRARRVVISAPLGVLKAGAIDFSPPVPVLKSVLAGLEMGPVLRLAFLFRRSFWASSAPDMMFLFSSEGLIPTWWTAHPDDAPLLTGWIGGTQAVGRTAGLRGAALIDVALEQLSTMFTRPRSEVRNLLVAARFHDWTTDPWSRGAYSYASVGGVDASNQLARSVDCTLFFAGEHTDTQGHWGTVHAALASGHRAAQDLLSSA